MIETLNTTAQFLVGISVLYVWTFRFHNVIKEFQQFGLSDQIRSIVGTSKISLSTLLIVGVWYPKVVLVAAGLMGLFMMGAQYHHHKARNSIVKRMPSLVLLVLCSSIIYFSI